MLFFYSFHFFLETISRVYYLGLLGMIFFDDQSPRCNCLGTTKSESFLQKGFILEVGFKKNMANFIPPISLRFSLPVWKGKPKKTVIDFQWSTSGPERSTPPQAFCENQDYSFCTVFFLMQIKIHKIFIQLHSNLADSHMFSTCIACTYIAYT